MRSSVVTWQQTERVKEVFLCSKFSKYYRARVKGIEMKRPQGRTEPGFIDQRVWRKRCTKRRADERGSTSTEAFMSFCYKHHAAKCVSVRRETVSDEGPQRLFYLGALLQCSQQEKGFDIQVS